MSWGGIIGYKKQIYIILVAGILIFFLIDISVLNPINASGPLPSLENNIAYCHYSENDILWMNGLEADTESVESHTDIHTNLADTQWTYGFPLREGPSNDTTLDNPIYFDTSLPANGLFGIRFETSIGTNFPSEVVIRLVSNGNVIGEDTSPAPSESVSSFQFNMNITEEYVNDLTLQIQFTEHRGITTITLYFEGETYVNLPITSPPSNDFFDSPHDDTSDNSSDDNKKESYGSEWVWIIIITGIIIIIVILVKFKQKDRNK